VRDGGRGGSFAEVPRRGMPGRSGAAAGTDEDVPGRVLLISSAAEPSASRRAFSCFDCTARKCESSSDHLISSRASLERVDSAETVLCGGSTCGEVKWVGTGGSEWSLTVWVRFAGSRQS